MSAQHTPGPWRPGRPDMATIVDGFQSKCVYAGDKQDAKCIAAASGQDIDSWDEIMANAILIAAAPTMLAALKTTAANIRSLGPAGALPEPYTVWLRVVDEAIAAAEQQS